VCNGALLGFHFQPHTQRLTSSHVQTVSTNGVLGL
jgi:hypothetical protein